MERLLNKVLKILSEHVNQNNDEIRFNQDDINRMLSEHAQNGKSSDLDFKYSLNKELLDENADFINFQLSISEFMEKYEHLLSSLMNPQDLSEDDEPVDGSGTDSLFLQTVSGKIKFDSLHPNYNDPTFFNRLLKHYEAIENYEMCNTLLKMNKSHS